MRLIIALLFVNFTIATLFPSVAVAIELQQDSKSPIEILSDEVRYLNEENKAIFIGDVVARQDDLVVKSKSMEVIFTKDESKKKAANGEAKTNISKIYFKGDVDITTKDDHATADNGEYDVKDGIFTLKGNVKLEQGGSILTGDELVHVKNTGESMLKSGKTGTRVKAHIVQKEGIKK
jgi:lipopolysaccharide export system protein LptA